MKIAGLILSIVAFVGSIACWFLTYYIQLVVIVLAIAGLVLSAVAGKKEKSGAATTGLVFGIIATVLSVIAFATCGMCQICLLC
ncbi:MAG: hypothetical protein IJC07_02210 [Clostridia bacterium]|nr:hypothetical protein [Clostridia bacterium]